MTKMESLKEGSDAQVLMETLFTMAARDLVSTIGAASGQTQEELKLSLIELWENDLLRWVSIDVESDSEPCCFLEILHPGEVWKAVSVPSIH